MKELNENKTNQQQLFENFINNSPMTTKGLILFEKDELDNEIVTAVLTGDLGLYTSMKSSAITEIIYTTDRELPASMDSIDIITQCISKLCDKSKAHSADLSPLFNSAALFTKGESVGTSDTFNLPTIVLSNNPEKLNLFTKNIMDKHVDSQLGTRNQGKIFGNFAHKMVDLNVDLAINDAPIDRVTIDTVELAHDTVEEIKNNSGKDVISLAIERSFTHFLDIAEDAPELN